MSPTAVSSQGYEVVCPRCEVTFAPETRRCVHCGGATMRPAEARAHTHAPGPVAPDRRPPFSLERPPPPGMETEEDEDVPAGRTSSWISRAMGLVWIAALVAITAYRACTGQGPS